MEEAKTIISDDVEINGSIKCTAGVRLAGKVNGDLTCGGDVLVEKGAAVKGNIAAASVIVQGMVKGNIVAKERIELKGTARVAGDLKAKRLVVEEGVTLVGKSEISTSDAGSGEISIEAEPAPAAEEFTKVDEDALKAGIPARPVMDRGRTGQLFGRK